MIKNNIVQFTFPDPKFLSDHPLLPSLADAVHEGERVAGCADSEREWEAWNRTANAINALRPLQIV
jgi:hypothetical protein